MKIQKTIENTKYAHVGRSVAVFRLLFLVILSSFLVLGMFALSTPPAEAASSFADDGYVNELMSGKSNSAGGWNENVIAATDPSELAGTSSDSLIQQVSDFFLNFGLWIIGFSVVFAVARLAGRALYEMVLTDTKGNKGVKGKEGDVECPAFFLTSKERKHGLNTEWFIPMLAETGLYLGIGLFVGTILSILTGIAFTILDFGNANIMDGSQFAGDTTAAPSTSNPGTGASGGDYTDSGAPRSIRNL